MGSAATPTRLVAFFDPERQGKDPRNRSLADILAWSDEQLEYGHDWVQNVFPLPEGSMFNHAIWLITPEDYDTFRQQESLRQSAASAFDRVCEFYGLKSDSRGGSPVLVRGPNFLTAKRNWVSRFNHNHLRITRILRSLRCLGLDQKCEMLRSFLSTDDEVASKVSTTSQMFWDRAAFRPLRLPPDEDDEAAPGIAWLSDK